MIIFHKDDNAELKRHLKSHNKIAGGKQLRMGTRLTHTPTYHNTRVALEDELPTIVEKT